MDSYEICRVCVEEVNEYWVLFESYYMAPLGTTTPARIIAAITSIVIKSDDGLPEFVCNSCLEAMKSAYQIREKCISSDRKLRKLLLQNRSSNVGQGIQQSEQAIQTENETTLNEIELISHTVLSMDEQEAHETADKDSKDNDHSRSHNGPEQVDTSDLISYNEESLTNVQQKYEADDEQEDPDVPIDNQTIDMEVQIIQNEGSEASIEVEHWENSPNIIVTDNNEDATSNIACDLCGKHFKTKGNLKAHILLHNNYKPFRCEQCGEEFSRKHNYNVHMLRHTGKRIHQCPKCDKSFVCTVNLKRHMVKHSNVKPFKCERCGMEFSYRTDLVRHEISHTGVYPFACEFCQHKFSRKCSLMKHLPKCGFPRKKRVSKEKSGI